MARRNRDPEREAKREKMSSLLQELKVSSMEDIHDLFKEMIGTFLENGLEGELDEELGYSKYDYKNKQGSNSRNGSYSKTVSSSQGPVELKVPRDREGEYEPEIVKKGQMDISAIEDKILFLYSQGTSTREIERTMQEMYGIMVDATRVSRITDKILPLIREWQNRPLETCYAHVVLDAIHYKVREEGTVVKKAVYIAIGTDMAGMKEVLGLWIGETESSKYWLGVLNGLKARGVEHILIISVDGLNGFTEAIEG